MTIESTDRAVSSGVATEDIEVSELVADLDTGGVQRMLGSDGRMDGVAAFPRSGDAASDDEKDSAGAYLYEASEDDRVPYGGNTQGDLIHVKALHDDGSAPGAPSIDHGTVVGVIDETATDAPATACVAGRIVQEGYTNDGNGDGTSTTFNRSNGNFIPVGIAYRDSAASYDERVRVRRRSDL